MIQSVYKATKVLKLFAQGKPLLGITEISRELELSKGTVQSIVKTLVECGFLMQDSETNKYQLGLSVFELGDVAKHSIDINKRVTNQACYLAEKLHSTIRIGVKDNFEVIVTLNVHSEIEPQHIGYFSRRVPMYCTALGKAILAYMPPHEIEKYVEVVEFIPYTPNTITSKDLLIEELIRTRERGYSINREEHWLHRVAVGAPVFDRNGKVNSSICISGDSSAVTNNFINSYIKEVVKLTSDVSAEMGYERR